jgi:hypothetical protein
MKKLILLVALVPVLLSSCKKDLIEKANLDSTQKVTTEFKKLNVKQDFDWSSVKLVDFKVQGLQTMATINRTLKVSSLDGKATYFTATHQMDQDMLTKITLPKSVKEVKVTYGSIEKVVSSTTSEIKFDFIPASTEE